MKVSRVSVWREVKVEEEDAKFGRTMSSVGDAGDLQNLYDGCHREDGECLQSEISGIAGISLSEITLREDIWGITEACRESGAMAPSLSFCARVNACSGNDL